MSYIVLARKYRPQTFEEVYAQDHITEILRNAIISNRIAHAYLFTGPRGVGKTSLARIMAKNLNCVDGPTTTPCNKCHNCVEITSGTSPDVIEIDGASNTSVDDVRELQKELIYAPSQSKYKIYIIDEVHMLSKSAFNALLKTLEEPPENVLFIFATTEPFKVLPTIISRCQRYDFKRIPIESIVNRLTELMKEEGVSCDAESLHLVARKADGSLRDALSLMDQVLSYCQESVTVDKVREIFGLIPTQVFCDMMSLIRAQDNQGLLNKLQEIFEQGTDLTELVNHMLEFLRIVILRQLGMNPQEITAGEYAAYDEVAKAFSRDNLMYIMSFLMQTRTEIRSSINPYLVFEMAMLRLCRLDEMEDIAKAVEMLKSGTGSQQKAEFKASPARTNPSPETVVRPAPTPQTPIRTAPEQEASPKREFNAGNLAAVWDKILARFKHQSGMAGIALASSEYSVTEQGALSLGVTGKMNYNAVQTKKDELQKLLREMFGTEIRIVINELEAKIPPRVEIARKTIEDLKKLDPNLARYIEITDSKISNQ